MSLLKYIYRLKQMDDLIRRKATGTPDEFAKRLGLGKTVLMEELRELKELGADVVYCRIRESYYYNNAFILKIGIDKNELQVIKGGQNYFQDLSPVRYYRTDGFYFSRAKMLLATALEP